MKKNKGFTLIELIIVLAIIGFIAVLVPPYFINSLEKLNLRSSANKFTSSLRYARSYAITEKRSFFININLDKSYFFLSRENGYEKDFNKKRIVITKNNIKTSSFNRGKKKKKNEKEIIESAIFFYQLPKDIFISKFIPSGKENGFAITSGQAVINFSPQGSSAGGTIVISNKKQKDIKYFINTDPMTGKISISNSNKKKGRLNRKWR